MEESRLAYLAVKAGVGLGKGAVAVFDTGGGSTQLTFGHADRVDERFSVGVGALRYTERFGLARAVDDGTLEAALTAISADLARLDGPRRVDVLVGMGGAITNIAAVSLRPRDLRSGHRPGNGPRPRRDRSPVGAVPHQRP